ncbi:alginate export family protein [Methyloglobulus sp.]|uniref:alginate export family protein n=1 Tax=Methyloglobulus sp. TaxID=2518622 RepID=UPI0032B7D5AD
MKQNKINSIMTVGLVGLLLTLPGLATAEDYYRKTRGYRVEPETDPPSYVRNLSKTQFEQFRDVEWLDVGLEHRTRFEYRENDYRPTPTGNNNSTTFRHDPDSLWLLRTRAYLGVHDILDPLRFAVEFQDSRSYNGLYERNVSDVNEFELIQGYAELYFKNLLGHNRPLSIRAGRQHLELLDRRLVGNNQFRNTTNNFEGFRVHFGKPQNNWDLDTFAFQPIERLKYNFDRADEDTWFYGGVFSWRGWSDYITIQPYFFGRKVNGDPYNSNPDDRKNDMDIFAPGVRAYGVIGDSGFDFDANINKQFGRFGVTRRINDEPKQFMLQHDALAYALELGYTFDHEWKPRVSLFYGYGTGDKDPNRNITSGSNERFDSFYGFNQPWSRNDYFSWDNIHAPKARIGFTPHKDVRVDAGYNAYWLQSETDAWSRANIRDTTGNSGSFLGHEFDIRVRHKLNTYVDWSLSYARFEPGSFTRKQNFFLDFPNSVDGPYTDRASNFFYFEVSLNAFGDGKPTYK